MAKNKAAPNGSGGSAGDGGDGDEPKGAEEPGSDAAKAAPEAAKPEPAKTDSKSAKTESAKTESPKTEPAKAAPKAAKDEPAKAEPAKDEPAKDEPAPAKEAVSASDESASAASDAASEEAGSEKDAPADEDDEGIAAKVEVAAPAKPTAAKAAAKPAAKSGRGATTRGKEKEAAPAKDPEPEIRIAAPSGPHGAAWAMPFVKLARGLDWLETRLLAIALFGLVILLAGWVSLAGMASPLESDSAAGTVFRGIAGAIILGGASRLAGKRLGLDETKGAYLTIVAIIAAVVLAPAWRRMGVDYFGHLQNWLQEGSSLAMLGGLRGVGTRLTILLALVGGSLAAAGGKHISIDVVFRFVPKRLQLPVFAISSISTAAVLVGTAWGFVDYIAIESYNYRPADMQQASGAAPQANASEELRFIAKHIGQDLFLFRKQVGLDFSSFGHVISGGKWDDRSRMNGRQWNAVVDDGFRDYFTAEEVELVRAPEDQLDEPRVPILVVPGGGGLRGLLIPPLNLMFPVGFLFIALRFLLRLVLVASGHSRMDGEGAHGGGTPADASATEEVA